MTPDPVIARLERARAGIRRALAQWDASDLERLEGSRKLLADAVADLRFFEHAVRTGGVSHSAELHATILAVKREVVEATKVVDAGVAFFRGLQARTSGVPPVYDSAGHIADESAEVEPEVHA
jgi:hypothetical protein